MPQKESGPSQAFKACESSVPSVVNAARLFKKGLMLLSAFDAFQIQNPTLSI